MRWIIDPGHGWLEVPLADYPDAINHGTDCEASSFLRSHPEIARDVIPCFFLDHHWVGRDTLERVPNVTKEG
jgi:hypothetical protein